MLCMCVLDTFGAQCINGTNVHILPVYVDIFCLSMQTYMHIRHSQTYICIFVTADIQTYICIYVTCRHIYAYTSLARAKKAAIGTVQHVDTDIYTICQEEYAYAYIIHILHVYMCCIHADIRRSMHMHTYAAYILHIYTCRHTYTQEYAYAYICYIYTTYLHMLLTCRHTYVCM